MQPLTARDRRVQEKVLVAYADVFRATTSIVSWKNSERRCTEVWQAASTVRASAVR